MVNVPVDGIAAANTMLGYGSWPYAGRCLQVVWSAYSANGAVDLTGEREPTAYDAWLHSDGKVTGVPFDKIPAGVPVYFGPKAGSAAGDVVICIGGGWCVATDVPGGTRKIGKMRLADRQKQIGRPYLGYTRTILDYPIKQGVAPKPPTPAPTPSEGIMVKHYSRRDTKAAGKGGLVLEPGEGSWLNTVTPPSARSQATNIVGGIGEYSFVTHVYAEGTPGDVVEVVLAWDDTKTTGTHSYHYPERLMLDNVREYVEEQMKPVEEQNLDDILGLIRASTPFARAVARGYAVYAHISAPVTNSGPVTVTRFDTDALLFV